MEGMIDLVCSFIADAAVVATVMGIMTRLINIWLRAVTGKEDIF